MRVPESPAVDTGFELCHRERADDWFPHYALGNLWYDKGVWFKAIKCWKDALEVSPQNSAVMRNLAIATYNKLGDRDEALRLMERAALYAPDDARLYYELDILRRLMNYPVKKRLKDMADKIELVESRDDLFTEYITLLNSEKYYEFALRAINRHSFHPWDGGSGRIIKQYSSAHTGIARELISDGDYEGAIAELDSALSYPENLGEGRPDWCRMGEVYYTLGYAFENVDKIEALKYYQKVIEETNELGGYPSESAITQFFFRTLAFGRLGKTKEEQGGYNRLIDYSEQHMDDEVELDYFSVLNSDFVVFDGDVKQINYVNCCYMSALGYYGKGMKEKSDEFIEKGLAVDAAHPGLLFIKHIDERAPKMKEDDPTLLRPANWNTTK